MAITLPSCGFSLALSGTTMPLAVFSSGSTCLTTTRSPIGFSAIGGGVLGFAAGGLPGALLGGAAGIAAASPANIVRFGPGIARGAAAVSRGAGALSRAESTAAGRILRRGAVIPPITTQTSRLFGKHIADQDKKKKRKAYFTAQ